MLTIYGIPTLNTVKIVLTAEVLELDYDYVPFDLAKGDQKTPEHLARHPLGKVPAIEHDGRALFESNAIAVYLASVSRSSLWPEGAYEQGLVHQWIAMISFHPGRWLAEHYFQYFIRPTFLGQDGDPDALQEADTFLDQQLPVVETHLSKQPWFCGHTMTVADLVAFAYFHTHEVSGYSIGQYAEISDWYGRIRGSEAYARTAQRLALQA